MIRYARENAPGVDFTVADVRDFRLGAVFDAAYCVYESLNHVRDIAGLKLAFLVDQETSRAGRAVPLRSQSRGGLRSLLEQSGFDCGRGQRVRDAIGIR